jgi:signal transduction histidine kinase
MFTSISRRIALLFTGFVFLLFLVNGALFLAADIGDARRQMGSRLGQTVEKVLELTRIRPDGVDIALPPMLREQVRVVDASGRVLHAGGYFQDFPFAPVEGIAMVELDGQQYAMLTTSIRQNGEITGYVQIMEIVRLRLGDLPRRALIYTIVSILISALTFIVGRFFAHTSLKPAEQMMERLEQFTQDASHELRTPLTTLNSSLDLALETKQYREGLLSAKEDVKALTTLTERMLELARLDRFTFRAEQVDFSSMIEEVAFKHRPLAEKKLVKIETDVRPGIHVQGDPALIRQVIGNLLSNAVKFSQSRGGTVRLTLAKDHLIVADDGIGIDPERLPHIFDRFYQADASRAEGGYGLGLALVKRIIDLHGWSISAQSKKGQGTAFKIGFDGKAVRS